jgi:phage/plasmid-associated DNA primase
MTAGDYKESLAMLLGDYAASTAASTLVVSSNNRLSGDLIRLAGARLVTAAKNQHGQCFAEVKIKSFTGGDMTSAKPPRVGA